jgi:hypothetical protein
LFAFTVAATSSAFFALDVALSLFVFASATLGSSGAFGLFFFRATRFVFTGTAIASLLFTDVALALFGTNTFLRAESFFGAFLSLLTTRILLGTAPFSLLVIRCYARRVRCEALFGCLARRGPALAAIAAVDVLVLAAVRVATLLAFEGGVRGARLLDGLAA